MRTKLLILFLFVSLFSFSQGTRTLYYTTSSGVTPTSIPSEITNALAWYDFVDPTNLTKGASNHVSQVNDLTVNGFNLTQSDTTKQPRWYSDGVYFDGTSDWLQNLTLNNPQTLSFPMTYYLVFKYTGGTGPSYMVDGGIIDGRNKMVIQSGTYRAGTAVLRNTSVSVSAHIAICTFIFNDPGVTTSAFYLNDGAPVIFSIGGIVLKGITVGATFAGDTYAKMQMECIVIRHNSDNATQQTNVKTYLYSHYGVSAMLLLEDNNYLMMENGSYTLLEK